MKILCLIVSTALLLGAPCSSTVTELTDANFMSTLKDKEWALVLFQNPWCGYCKAIKPEFEAAATRLEKYEPPVYLTKMNCVDSGEKTCGKYSEDGFPTIRMFNYGNPVAEYHGKRRAEAIVRFARAHVGNKDK